MENKEEIKPVEKPQLRVNFIDWTPIIIPIEQIKPRAYYFAVTQHNCSWSRYWIYVTKIENEKISGYGRIMTVADMITSSQRERNTNIVEIEIDYNSENLYGFDYLTNDTIPDTHEQHLKAAVELNKEHQELEKRISELLVNQRYMDTLQGEIDRLKAKLNYTKPDNLLALGGFSGDYLQDIIDYIIEKFNDADSSADAVEIGLFKDKEILIAFINSDDYFESAFFLLKDTSGNLYEVHASHCSCMGFEGQFILEPTEIKALKYRIENADGLNSDIEGEDKEKVKKYITSL